MGDRTLGVIGSLALSSALEHPELLAPTVRAALPQLSAVNEVGVAQIDPAVADTAAFCARYGVRPDESANCVIVIARKQGATRLAACIVLATTRVDVNGLVRRKLDARKVSFAPMGEAIAETGMEYGGITAVGLPSGWPILIDAAVARHRRVVVGSGLRMSKLVLPGSVLSSLPFAEVVENLGR